MTAPITPVELYKLLLKTNCRDCGFSTCLAFAAAVMKQEKELNDCPHLSQDIIAGLEGKIPKKVNLETIQENQVKALRDRISGIDLVGRAETLGGRIAGDGIVIQCLGKDFEVDRHGFVSSHCHTHAWFTIPLLDYILSSNGVTASGNWAPLRELRNGRTWSRLFERRCEQPLKQIADSHSALFEDLVSMFTGSSSVNHSDADISVLLYPLPKVPMLISYWKPEDGMESRLHLFFDDTAESHLHIDSLFTLGTGIVRMIGKIMLKHADGEGITE